VKDKLYNILETKQAYFALITRENQRVNIIFVSLKTYVGSTEIMADISLLSSEPNPGTGNFLKPRANI
jgi:hypothetical protein